MFTVTSVQKDYRRLEVLKILEKMKKINEEFSCVNCWKKISKADKTCRNHCPYCFVSLHVDMNVPGDRKSICWGKMYPTQYEIRNWDLKILFECAKCWKKHQNKKSRDDKIVKLDELINDYKKYFF